MIDINFGKERNSLAFMLKTKIKSIKLKEKKLFYYTGNLVIIAGCKINIQNISVDHN